MMDFMKTLVSTLLFLLGFCLVAAGVFSIAMFFVFLLFNEPVIGVLFFLWIAVIGFTFHYFSTNRA